MEDVRTKEVILRGEFFFFGILTRDITFSPCIVYHHVKLCVPFSVQKEYTSLF